jgi:hypothetical protein
MLSDPTPSVQSDGLLAEHCRRHGLDLGIERAAIRCRERLDTIRYRSHACPSSDRESDSLRVEMRLLREQIHQLWAAMRRARHESIGGALAAVESRLTAELPAAVRHLVAIERSTRNGAG